MFISNYYIPVLVTTVTFCDQYNNEYIFYGLFTTTVNDIHRSTCKVVILTLMELEFYFPNYVQHRRVVFAGY